MSASSAVLQQAALSTSAYSRIALASPTPCIPSRQVFEEKLNFIIRRTFPKTVPSNLGSSIEIASLSTDVPAITASSGNHGLGLSTPELTGHNLTVVLPETVAREKLGKLRPLELKPFCTQMTPALLNSMRKTSQRTGEKYTSHLITLQIIAGQGTLTIELLDQLPRLDVVYVSIGGGLISGIGCVLKAFHQEQGSLV